MRVVFYGSGAFGLPSLSWLHEHHEVVQVVTQPDRPAGRGRKTTPTPIAAYAREHGLTNLAVENVSKPETCEQLSAIDASAMVVIAFGQKIPLSLRESCFSCNLHASLLPRFRGAAPINRAVMAQDAMIGLSVISLAERIDAGDVYQQVAWPLDPTRTAGEIHDMLANRGPTPIETVLRQFSEGTLQGQSQDETKVTFAAKLSRDDGHIDFRGTASEIRAHIHGVTPWPGARAQLGGRTCKLGRVEIVDRDEVGLKAGQLRQDLAIQCNTGAVRPIEIQPAGSRMMDYEAFCHGTSLTVGEPCQVA